MSTNSIFEPVLNLFL